MWIKSAKPSVTTSSVRTPVRSSRALVATVVPKTSAPRVRSAMTAASEGTFSTVATPSSSTLTTSVKVPPRSMKVLTRQGYHQRIGRSP